MANAKEEAQGRLGDRKLNPIVFLDIQIGDRAAGRITLELRADLLPITCENFRTLCTGEFGLNKDGRTLMHYKGCPFHRITPAQLCQSGDIKSKDGTWSESIFGQEFADGRFPDENFILRHTGPGVLSMVNSGPDSNGSGFYISFVECEWMNDKYVAFGCVCSEESLTVLFELERQGTDCGKAKTPVIISDCGQLYP